MQQSIGDHRRYRVLALCNVVGIIERFNDRLNANLPFTLRRENMQIRVDKSIFIFCSFCIKIFCRRSSRSGAVGLNIAGLTVVNPSLKFNPIIPIITIRHCNPCTARVQRIRRGRRIRDVSERSVGNVFPASFFFLVLTITKLTGQTVMIAGVHKTFGEKSRLEIGVAFVYPFVCYYINC